MRKAHTWEHAHNPALLLVQASHLKPIHLAQTPFSRLAYAHTPSLTHTITHTHTPFSCSHAEFITATCNRSLLEKKNVLTAAFGHFDRDKDGFITNEDLRVCRLSCCMEEVTPSMTRVRGRNCVWGRRAREGKGETDKRSQRKWPHTPAAPCSAFESSSTSPPSCHFSQMSYEAFVDMMLHEDSSKSTSQISSPSSSLFSRWSGKKHGHSKACVVM